MRVPAQRNQSKNRRVSVIAGAVALGMVGAAYAAVPLYAMFCQATGFGGTTQRSMQAPAKVADATVNVRFDANSSSELGWNFHPVQNVVTLKLGEQALAHYEAINQSSRTITGTAVFNVSPPEAGQYFNKIQCFCFTEQTLKPGERADLPVVFFVDPAMLNDPDAKSISEITLSYTFYPVSSSAVGDTAKLQIN